MITNICTLILYTLVIDVILFCAFLIFCYIYNLRRDIKKLNRISIKKILVNNILFIILFLLFIFWAISIILSFIGIADDNIDSKNFSSDTLYSCYITIIIGAVTIYFTVFAFIKPAKMTFVDYEALVVNFKAKFTYITIAFTFLVNSIAIFFNINNLFFRTAIVSNYLYIIIDLIFSIIDFNCLENEDKATEIFVKSICSKIRHNKRIKQNLNKQGSKKKSKKNQKKSPINLNQYALTLFTSYLIPCFKKTSFIVAFNKTDEIIKRLFPDFNNDEYKQYLYDFSFCTIDIYSWYADTYLKTRIKNSIKVPLIKNEMDEIIKINLVRILKNHEFITPEDLDKTIATAASLYEIWFKLYKMLFQYDKGLKYSEIEKGVEPLSFGILVFDKSKKEVTKNYIELYNNYLENAYQLVIFVLHNYNYLIFRSFLQDYIDTIQFVKLTTQYKTILNFRDYRLIVIGTFIANLIQEDRVSNKYKMLINVILKEVESIVITYDSFMYTEPLSLTGVHLIEKDFHYYFILMIIYALSSEKEEKCNKLLDEIIGKIKIPKNDTSVFETLYQTCSEMTDIDKIYKPLQELLLETIKSKVNNLKELEFERLEQLVNDTLDEKIQDFIEEDKNNFYEFFNFCSKIENNSKIDLLEIGIPKGFSFMHSANYILDKSSFDRFGIMTQFSYILPFIYHAYIVKANKKFISNIDDLLKDVDKLKEITLIMPIKFHSYFYTLKNIKYEGRAIIYNGYKINIKPTRDVSDFIIIEELLHNSIYIRNLKIDLSKKELIKDKDNCKIDVKIPIEPQFFIDINSSMVVYSLIGIQDNTDYYNDLIKITKNGRE